MSTPLLLLTQLLAASSVIKAATITLYDVPLPHSTYNLPPLATATYTPVGTGPDGTTYVGHIVATAAIAVSFPAGAPVSAASVVTTTFPSMTATVTIVEDASHISQHGSFIDNGNDGRNRSCTFGSDHAATCVFVDYFQSSQQRPGGTYTVTYTGSAEPIYTLVTNGEKGIRLGWNALLLGSVVSIGVSLGGIITMV